MSLILKLHHKKPFVEYEGFPESVEPHPQLRVELTPGKKYLVTKWDCQRPSIIFLTTEIYNNQAFFNEGFSEIFYE